MQRPGEARALRGHPSPRVGSARLITARRPLPGAVWERGGDGSLSATVPKTRHHNSIAEETVVLRDVPVKTVETACSPWTLAQCRSTHPCGTSEMGAAEADERGCLRGHGGVNIEHRPRRVGPAGAGALGHSAGGAWPQPPGWAWRGQRSFMTSPTAVCGKRSRVR